MQANITSSCALLLFCLFFNQITTAQTSVTTPSATIKGTVVEEKTQTPLPFVTVAVEGKNTGTTTNDQGIFLIDGLPADSYHLVFSYLGFARKRVENLRREGYYQEISHRSPTFQKVFLP